MSEIFIDRKIFDMKLTNIENKCQVVLRLHTPQQLHKKYFRVNFEGIFHYLLVKLFKTFALKRRVRVKKKR